MKRIFAFALSVVVLCICLTASPPHEAKAQYRLRGQDPFVGHAAMYCSSMYGMALNLEKTVNAPEGFKIVKFDIWALDTVTAVANLEFFFTIGGNSTDIDIAMLSAAGILTQCLWFWPFDLTCERIIFTNKTEGGDWAACVYLMRYGEDAGVSGVLHPWHLEP